MQVIPLEGRRGNSDLTVAELVKAVTFWAENQVDIISVALVGSHARGNSCSDSDVDFVILSTRPTCYLQDLSWTSAFGVARALSLEDWGKVQSVRAFYNEGLEVEYGITSLEWVKFPLDEGTVTVLQDGVVILTDHDGSLTRAVDWVNQSN